MTALWVILGVVLVLGLWLMVTYNRLVQLRNRFKNSFSQIDVQLQRRYDLIPNLLATAKAYMTHERETLTKVIEARNAAQKASINAGLNPGNPEAMKAFGRAEGVLGSALGQLNVVMEAYPELKADATMRQFSEELSSTENKVGFARQAYNDDVMFYNTERETFPTVLFAGMLGFHEAALFEIESVEQRKAVKVEF